MYTLSQSHLPQLQNRGGSGGEGEGGKRSERDLRCKSFTNQWKSKVISVQLNVLQI